MELAYPFVIYISIPIIILLILLKFKKINKYKEGRKIANTKYIKSIPYYKNTLRKYKIFSGLTQGICVLCILLSLILLARPAKIESSISSQYNRDIFLCMDVSTSVNELNERLVENLKEVVKNLKGERFGISIFNTSSVLLVPLTDDYEYITNVLDTLSKSLNQSNGKQENLDDYLYLINYIRSGTLVGNERGSSIIGDGLASCVYSFPKLEEKDRTKIIIFSTDNDLAGTAIVSLQEAAELSKEKNITVYGIGPETITTEDKEEIEGAIKTTGGTFYTETSSSTVDKIIKNINQKEKSLIQGNKETKKNDKPEVPFILLTLSVCALFVLNKKVNL